MNRNRILHMAVFCFCSQDNIPGLGNARRSHGSLYEIVAFRQEILAGPICFSASRNYQRI